MRFRPSRLLAVAAVCATTVGTLSGVAAAVGPGSFTTMTTPSGNLHVVYDAVTSSNNHFTVAGTTSNDVASVDIDCILIRGDGSREVNTLVSSVPVASGTFSSTVTYGLELNCRLRAVPTGVTATTDYLGSYTGPILYTDLVAQLKDSTPTQYGYVAYGEEGDGFMAATDAGECGVAEFTTISTPSVTLGPLSSGCDFGLLSGNVDPSGSATKSEVAVGGHIAYLPAAVSGYLRSTRGLTALAQPALATTKAIASNGDVTVTESGPLMRCDSDTYPPTAASCTQLIATGVTFQRTLAFFRNGHQIRIRDTFVSTDGLAHAVALEYRGGVEAPDTGKPGFLFPNHGTSFTTATLDQTVTGFGTAAGTALIRSDIYASSNEPSADTVGLTWSRPPSSVFFGTDTNTFGMRYALTVPAGAKAFLGFAESESLLTSTTRALGAAAVADMVNTPTIASPLNGARVPTMTTTVKGALTAGGNGLPTSVLVNGHAATIHKTSLTTATYAVTFSETWGSHVIAVTAKDVVGNTATKRITVTNTPALVFAAAAHLSGSTMTVALKCSTWSAGTCYGRLVVKHSTSTIGTTLVFAIAKGATKVVSVHLSPIAHSVVVFILQKEPTGAYPVASAKAFTI